MTERFAPVGDLELCYETFGNPQDPALLLIMGLATQMIGWREELCAGLAARGFHVIRFDNRDVGRSTTLSHIPPPTRWQLIRRDRSAAGYTLEDMADDAVGLLDHLQIETAHVAGASMGAMIAQTLAVHHPGRVRSLASIMGSTGARTSGQPRLQIARALMAPAPDDRAGYVEHLVRTLTLIGSSGFGVDERDLRRFAERSYDRGRDPAAAGRHLAAILASGDRTRSLRKVTAPTVVIHGSADILVRPSGGRTTARAIRGARLVEIAGMGHDLPRAAWPRIIGAVAENAARADALPEAA